MRVPRRPRPSNGDVTGTQVVIDATPSGDPDRMWAPRFLWECHVAGAPHTSCFDGDDGEEAMTMAIYERAHRRFPHGVAVDQPAMRFAAWMLSADHNSFLFKLTVFNENDETKTNEGQFQIDVDDDPSKYDVTAPTVKITCPLCDSSASRHGLVMTSSMSEGGDDDVKVTWSVSRVRSMSEDDGEGDEETEADRSGKSQSYDCSPRSRENVYRLQGNATEISKLEEKLYYLGAYRYLSNYTEALARNVTSQENASHFDEMASNVTSSNYVNLLHENGDDVGGDISTEGYGSDGLPGWLRPFPHGIGEGGSMGPVEENENGGNRFVLPERSDSPAVRSGFGFRLGSRLGSFGPDFLVDGSPGEQEKEEILQHISHRVDDRASNENEMIVLHPGQLREGQLYAVTVDYHHSVTGKLLTSSSKLVRTHEGPRDGRCAVINLFSTHNMYRVYCRDWKVPRQNVNDAQPHVDEDEILFYAISYSLEGARDDYKRPIYYGTLFTYDFYLPLHLTKQIWVNVEVMTENGDVTTVCSYPVNSTVIQETQAYAALDMIYDDATNTSGNLIHFRHEHDDNAIILFNHIALDTLQSLNISADDQYKVEEIFDALTMSLLEIEGGDLRKVEKVIKCCETIKTFSPTRFECATTGKVSRIVGKHLRDSARTIRNQTQNGIKINRIAEEVKLHDSSKRILTRAVRLYDDVIGTTCDKRNFGKEIAAFESAIGEFMLASNRWRLSFDPVSLTSHNHVAFLAQSARLKSFFKFQTDKLQVGVELPQDFNFDAYYDPELLQQTLTSYEGVNPLFFTKTQTDLNIEDYFLSIKMSKVESGEDVFVHQNDKNIKVKLPPRTRSIVYKPNCIVSSDQVVYHRIKLNSSNFHKTLHIDVRAQQGSTRLFPVSVFLYHRKLSPDDIMTFRSAADFGSSSDMHGVIGKRTSRSNSPDTNHSIKLALSSQSMLRSNSDYYLHMWKSHRRDGNARDDVIGGTVTSEIDLMVTAWSSDCFFWVEPSKIWSKNGIEVSKESSMEQTICLTNHLRSPFASSHRSVEFETSRQKLFTKRFYGDYLLLLCTATLIFLVAMAISHRLLDGATSGGTDKRHLSDDALWEDDVAAEGGGGGWRSLRRWIGACNVTEPVVPIVIGENKFYHTQIFEVTVQTGCWPGSGASDVMGVYVTMHGSRGSYRKRKLCRNEGSGRKCGDGECLFGTASAKVFLVTYDKDLGDVTHITITCVDQRRRHGRHNRRQNRPDHDDALRWYLDYVIVRDVNAQTSSYFPCHGRIGEGGIGKRRHVRKIRLRKAERNPPFFSSLLVRMRNSLLESHSLISIVTCPHWGSLQRSQRIIHLMAITLMIVALSCSQHFFNITFLSVNSLSGTMLERGLWSVAVAVCSWLLAQPGHMVLRCTELDERISVVMEDDTSIKNASSNLPDEIGASLLLGGGSGHRINKDPSRAGLRKTETLAQFNHDFDFDLTINDGDDVTTGCDVIIDHDDPHRLAEYMTGSHLYEIHSPRDDSDDAQVVYDNLAFNDDDNDVTIAYPQIHVIHPSCNVGDDDLSTLSMTNDDVTIASASIAFSVTEESGGGGSSYVVGGRGIVGDGAMSFVPSRSSQIPESCSDYAWTSIDQSGIVLHEKIPDRSGSSWMRDDGGGGGRRMLPRYFTIVATCYYLLLIISAFVLLLHVAFFNPRPLDDALSSSAAAWCRTALFAFLLTSAVIEVTAAAVASLTSELASRWCGGGGGLDGIYPSVDKVVVDEFFYKTNERAFDIKDDDCLLITPKPFQPLKPLKRNHKRSSRRHPRPHRRHVITRRRRRRALRVAGRFVGAIALVLVLVASLRHDYVGARDKGEEARSLRHILPRPFVVRDSLIHRLQLNTSALIRTNHFLVTDVLTQRLASVYQGAPCHPELVRRGLVSSRRCAGHVRVSDKPSVTTMSGAEFKLAAGDSERADRELAKFVTFNPLRRVYARVELLRGVGVRRDVGGKEVEVRTISLHHLDHRLNLAHLLFIVWLAAKWLAFLTSRLDASVSMTTTTRSRYDFVEFSVWALGAAHLGAAVVADCAARSLRAELERRGHEVAADGDVTIVDGFDRVISCEAAARALLGGWLVMVLVRSASVFGKLRIVLPPFTRFTRSSFNAVFAFTAFAISLAYVTRALTSSAGSPLDDVMGLAWPALMTRNNANLQAASGVFERSVAIAAHVVMFVVVKLVVVEIIVGAVARNRQRNRKQRAATLAEAAAERYLLSRQLAKAKRRLAKEKRRLAIDEEMMGLREACGIIMSMTRHVAVTCLSRLPDRMRCCLPYVSKLMTRRPELRDADNSSQVRAVGGDNSLMSSSKLAKINYFDSTVLVKAHRREFYGVVVDDDDDDAEGFRDAIDDCVDDDDVMDAFTDCQDHVLTTEAVLAEVESQVDEFYLRVSAWLDDFFLDNSSATSSELTREDTRCSDIRNNMEYQNEVVITSKTTEPTLNHIDKPQGVAVSSLYQNGEGARQGLNLLPKSEKLQLPSMTMSLPPSEKDRRRHTKASASCHARMRRKGGVGKTEKQDSAHLPGYIPDDCDTRDDHLFQRSHHLYSGKSY